MFWLVNGHILVIMDMYRSFIGHVRVFKNAARKTQQWRKRGMKRLRFKELEGCHKEMAEFTETELGV